MISHEVFGAAGVDGERCEAGRGVCTGKKLKETQAREAEVGRVRDGTDRGPEKGPRRGCIFRDGKACKET